jgi:hypothetical protein
MFFRSMGSAVGAAVFGAIANTTLNNRFRHPPAGLGGRLPRNADATSLVLGHHPRESPGVAAYIRTSLYWATHHVFITIVVVAALCVLAVAAMPRRTAELPS